LAYVITPWERGAFVSLFIIVVVARQVAARPIRFHDLSFCSERDRTIMGLPWWFSHSSLSKQHKTIDGKSEDCMKTKAKTPDFSSGGRTRATDTGINGGGNDNQLQM